MPRKTRSKSRNSKSNSISENLIMIEEHSHDLNGSTSLDPVDTPSCPLSVDISKKRPAEVSDDANESNSEDAGPPRKKRNNQELQRVTNKGLKRSMVTLDEECHVIKAKNAKLENIESFRANFHKRVWKESASSSVNSHAQNCPENLPHFVIATYNILLDENLQSVSSATKSNCADAISDKTLHFHLMQELDFINADILCLQQVNYSYWKETLECSLKERGYTGDIVVGDKLSNVGVATLYQICRFAKVDIDSNKLSKLCVEQIPSNSGLDDATLNAIKQYLDEPDSYIVTVLKDKQIKDERLLIVGNTHLSSHSIGKPDLRCVQAVGMFWRIHRMISQIKSDLINNNNSGGSSHNDGLAVAAPCWILCGDFNSNTDSPVYQICRDGYPDEHSIAELQALRRVPIDNGAGRQSCSLVDLLWHGFQHPLTDSVSSYLKVTSYEPCRDYIWMSERGLQPSKVLMPCSSEYHQAAGGANAGVASSNNNRLLPSDQIMSLACDVAFMT